MNSVQLIGRIGKDPEIHTFESGKKVARLSVCTGRKYTNKDGQEVDNTNWHNVKVIGSAVSIVEKFLSKGTQIGVNGSINYGSYEKNGNTYYYTDIICNQLHLISSKSNSDGVTNAIDNNNSDEAAPESDDLPF